MIAVDANLLVYAHVDGFEQPVALDWLEARLAEDAHVAALAIEHGLKLATADSGFARFEGLDWFNPLSSL